MQISSIPQETEKTSEVQSSVNICKQWRDNYSGNIR
jgi:hypothetical protein